MFFGADILAIPEVGLWSDPHDVTVEAGPVVVLKVFAANFGGIGPEGGIGVDQVGAVVLAEENGATSCLVENAEAGVAFLEDGKGIHRVRGLGAAGEQSRQ